MLKPGIYKNAALKYRNYAILIYTAKWQNILVSFLGLAHIFRWKAVSCYALINNKQL
jgi:hypothetical protein